MKIAAQVLAHSKNEFGDELITYVVTFPRFILAEGKTHRVISGMLEEVSIGLNDEPMFSRNSASSRAIPFNKMVESVKENPFIPIAWQREHKGMQGTAYFTDPKDIEVFVNNHLAARDYAVFRATAATESGLTKQLANRYLEPFMWHTVIITTSKEGLENFFNLRCPSYEMMGMKFRSREDCRKEVAMFHEPSEMEWFLMNKGQAEIHMMALAEAMWDARNESKPQILKAGQWHIPYWEEIYKLYGPDIRKMVDVKPTVPIAAMISSVMCARVSYTVAGHDLSEWTLEKYVTKAIELSDARPLHASPFEHNAQCMSKANIKDFYRKQGTEMEFGWCRNFKGFIQLRHIVEQDLVK